MMMILKFTMSMVKPRIVDFDSIPVSAREYIQKYGERLNMIRS